MRWYFQKETVVGYVLTLRPSQIQNAVDALFCARRLDEPLQFSETIPPFLPGGHVARLINAESGTMDISLLIPESKDGTWPIPEPYWIDTSLPQVKNKSTPPFNS